MPKAPVKDTELFYTTVGEGVPCLVMHGGLGLDHTYLHPWLDPLGDTLKLIYYDHRGNGRSGRPAKETLTVAQFAADAAELVAHLGYEKVAVLGHSYGGVIGLEFALRYPERLSHLVLLDSVPTLLDPVEIQANAIRNGATDEILVNIGKKVTSNEEFAEKLMKIAPIYYKTYDEKVVSRMMGNCIFSIEGRAAEGEWEAFNVIPRLGEIQVPALIMVGRYDFICPPSMSETMHQGIPDSELVIFEDSGHFPFVEEADAFFKTVKDWFNKTNLD